MEILAGIIGALFTVIFGTIQIIVSVAAVIVQEFWDHREVMWERLRYKPMWAAYCFVLALFVCIYICFKMMSL